MDFDLGGGLTGTQDLCQGDYAFRCTPVTANGFLIKWTVLPCIQFHVTQETFPRTLTSSEIVTLFYHSSFVRTLFINYMLVYVHMFSLGDSTGYNPHNMRRADIATLTPNPNPSEPPALPCVKPEKKSLHILAFIHPMARTTVWFQL